MASVVKRYLDLCNTYSAHPNADVAVWLRLQSRVGLATAEMDKPPSIAEDNRQKLGRRGWKAAPGCDCRIVPGGGPGVKSIPTSTEVSATLVIRPQPGKGSTGFTDMDMLPLCDLLTESLEEDSNAPGYPLLNAKGSPCLSSLRSLDLSHCCIRRSGVLLLCDIVLTAPACNIVTLNLSSQKIGSTGALALAAAVRKNKNVKELLLHNCWLRAKGGIIFAELLAEKPQSHALTLLDLSNNMIPMQICVDIETSVGMKMTPEGLEKMSSTNDSDIPVFPVMINTDGNRVFDEVLNAVSHGIAFIASIVGCVFLGLAVRSKPAYYKWSVTLYLISLCGLFLASTLYHSFFSLSFTRIVFSVLDHSAIYLLIAGSYTPILAILFPDKPEYSRWLLGFMWLMCVLGIFTTVILSEGKFKKILSLSLYLGMGWVAILINGDLMERVASTGVQLLVAGGLLYTGGVPFFVKTRQTLGVPDHTIWHIFVLAGASAHYAFILQYVVPARVPEGEILLPVHLEL